LEISLHAIAEAGKTADYLCDQTLMRTDAYRIRRLRDQTRYSMSSTSLSPRAVTLKLIISSAIAPNRHGMI